MSMSMLLYQSQRYISSLAFQFAFVLDSMTRTSTSTGTMICVIVLAWYIFHWISDMTSSSVNWAHAPFLMNKTIWFSFASWLMLVVKIMHLLNWTWFPTILIYSSKLSLTNWVSLTFPQVPEYSKVLPFFCLNENVYLHVHGDSTFAPSFPFLGSLLLQVTLSQNQLGWTHHCCQPWIPARTHCYCCCCPFLRSSSSLVTCFHPHWTPMIHWSPMDCWMFGTIEMNKVIIFTRFYTVCK